MNGVIISRQENLISDSDDLPKSISTGYSHVALPSNTWNVRNVFSLIESINYYN